MADESPSPSDFTAAWSTLPPRDRRRIRRLVRMGHRVEPEEAALAVGYAAAQCRLPWIRFFWLWFLPGLAFALFTASQVHPVVVGVVLALAAQALFARRNLTRTARAVDPNAR